MVIKKLILILNIKVILSAKMFYSGVENNYNSGYVSYGKTRENKEEGYFIEEKVKKEEIWKLL